MYIIFLVLVLVMGFGAYIDEGGAHSANFESEEIE